MELMPVAAAVVLSAAIYVPACLLIQVGAAFVSKRDIQATPLAIICSVSWGVFFLLMNY